jgi:hypothetical protein
MADMALQFKKVVSFQEKIVTSIDQKLRILADQTAVEKRILTPSNGCLSENSGDFTRLFSLLRLAEGPLLSALVEPFQGDLPHDLPKFTFKWKADPILSETMADVAVQEKVIERSSYLPLVQYLSEQSLHAVDVSEGHRCPNKNLFDSEVHTIRPNTTFDTKMLCKVQQCPFFIQQIRGRTDIVIIDERYASATNVTKFQVRVAIEIKTVNQMNKTDACLREAAVQLVGLNTENIERTPPVLLTNLCGRHFVLYLSMLPNPDVHLVFKIHIIQFDTFEQALEFSLRRGDLPPITSYFGRKPTPPASVGSEGSKEEEEYHD